MQKYQWLLFMGLFGVLLHSGCEEIATLAPRPVDSFIKFYGGMSNQRGGDIQATPDGGFILIGTTTSYGAGGSDIFVVKTDTAGNALWTQTYGGPFDDKGSAILPQAQGEGFVILGDYGVDEGGDITKIWVIEIDNEGGISTSLILNENRESIESSADIQLLTHEEGYIIIGNTTQVDTTKNDWNVETDIQDIYVARVTWAGDTLRKSFEQEHGFANEDEGIGIRTFEDGSYDILGNSLVTETKEPRIIFSKISVDGIPIISTKIIERQASASQLISNGDLGYIVAGSKEQLTGSIGFWALLDDQGNTTSPTRATLSDLTNLSHIIPIDGGYLLAGESDNSTNGRAQDFVLQAVAAPGAATIWGPRLLGSSGDDFMSKIISTPKGFAFVGTSNFSNITNLSLIQVNEQGEL